MKDVENTVVEVVEEAVEVAAEANGNAKKYTLLGGLVVVTVIGGYVVVKGAKKAIAWFKTTKLYAKLTKGKKVVEDEE